MTNLIRGHTKIKKKFIFCLSILASSIIPLAFATSSNPTVQPNECVRYIENHKIVAPPIVLLDLGNCRLQDHNLSDVLAYLSNNPSIDALFLDNNNISPNGAKILAESAGIAFIGLDDNHIGSEGAEALATNQFVTGLSLANNYVGTEGALAIAKSKTLKMLNVTNNNIKSAGITALANNHHIASLSVGGNELDQSSVTAIINHKALKELDISYTNANSHDVVAILNELPALQSLGIDGLHLGDQITPALAQKKSLMFLDVIENDLTSKGAATLVGLIDKNFIDIDISHNLIGDEGVAQLAKGQAEMLAFLWMEDNNIGDEGALALANTSMPISDLNISHNHISKKGIDALRNNPMISYINADYNNARTTLNLSAIKSHCNKEMSSACLSYLKRFHQ